MKRSPLSCALILVITTAAAGATRPKKPVYPRPTFEFPEGAIRYHFGGGRAYPQWITVRESNAYDEKAGYGFVSTEGLLNGGNSRQWPFGLVANYLWTSPKLEKPAVFRAKVPNGTYNAWLLGGRLIRPDVQTPHFLLTINHTTVFDEKITPEQFNSETHLFRFLWTRYSERSHYLWESYISKVFPMSTHTVKVENGELTMRLRNVILAGLVLLPADRKTEFEALVKTLHDESRKDYEDRCEFPKQTKPERGPNDGDFFLYVPKWGDTVMPDSAPPVAERGPVRLAAAGAPGQRVTMRLAVVPFADLGKCTLELSDLKGPATIPASAIKAHYKNYFVSGLKKRGRRGMSRSDYRMTEIRESVLLPALTLEMERAITQEYWLVLTVPADAKPGAYQGTFVFRPGKGAAVKVPVNFEVYPFKLADALPVSLGMYGTGVKPPLADDKTQRRLLKERLQMLRDWGFTACEVKHPSLRRLNKDGTCDLMYRDADVLPLAREVGMGATPEQTLMVANYFMIGRYIGYKTVGKVDANGRYLDRSHLQIDRSPGLELRQPGFERYFLDATRQYKAYLAKHGLPVVLNVADEPREKSILPWNRNFDDSVAYIKMIRKVGGLTVAMNPMRDFDRYTRKDYTPLVDHVDVLSTHAWAESAKLIKQTLAKGKTLWLYNSGKDRFSWGFYNWRAKAKGRWEWHLCWPNTWSWEYVQSLDWYSPFTKLGGLAPLAPYSKHRGGMLYRSNMLAIMEGITDYAYLYTLEQAINAPGADAKVVAEARALLATLGKEIPEFPTVKGLRRGADVGQAMIDKARYSTGRWRRRIADLLKRLKR